jgi:hypothetical protein
MNLIFICLMVGLLAFCLLAASRRPLRQAGVVLGLAILGLFYMVLPASAHFIDGFLAQCTAVGTGTCTETTAAGYLRQPVYFTTPVRGVAPLGTAFTFGPAGVGTFAGRAIYDAPTGGNLLFVLPFAAPLVAPSPGDHLDVGAMKLTFTALVPYLLGETYLGTAAAAAAVGFTSDGSVISTGHTVTFLRGTVLPGTLAPT